MQFDVTALIDEFDRVLNQVIYYLMDHIRIAVDKQALRVLRRSLGCFSFQYFFKGN